ncbi:MAG: dihydroorotase [Bacteroidetes bacterium]|nr:MAG: dihydroorotase [Bacteroidota bacterium]
MSSILIRHAQIVNEGVIREADVFVRDGIIYRIGADLGLIADTTLDARGKWLMPGVIDDQVHFREPGLTHKGDLYTESRAAVAGGVTSYMEMPNTQPQTLTQELLEAKYRRAAEVSAANYSFFMGASNDNLEEVLKTDAEAVCGIKVFMGSSTGNMLVDNPGTLEQLFSRSPLLIATHCEQEETIKANLARFREQYGEDIPVECHPLIRSAEACYQSSSLAVDLARRHGARLHVLHISTAIELELFDNQLPLLQKRITSEACIHHLWFSDEDYARLGNRIKWNPAVKSAEDRAAIRQALIEGRLDIVATDHAPHTSEEKAAPYLQAPSGGPLVQHSLVAMLELASQGLWSVPFVVEKMCHAPAQCFRLKNRGYIREGYHADLVLVDPDAPWQVNPANLRYKCGWSPFEGQTFRSKVETTIVSGRVVYHQGQIDDAVRGERLRFAADRH